MTKRRHPHGVFWPILLAIAALALALRLPELGRRPMHTDETINAFICGQLLEGEVYRYDPQDRHGPALYLSALPVLRLAGVHSLADMDERSFRLTAALLSALAVLFFAGLRHPLGDDAALLAALFWAAAPLPLYYGRYMIHETGFVAMSIGLVATGWQAVERRSAAWAAVAGAFAALMLAFKETAIINYAAIGAAFLFFVFTTRHAGIPPRTWLRMAVAGTLACFVVLLVLFTWGFTDWGGPGNLARAFVRFSGRAGGEGHQKPFWYFARLLADGWGGRMFLVLAACGAVRAWRAGGFDRALVVWLAAVFLLHSAIPYKTPWLALNIWLPLALLAAFFLAGFQSAPAATPAVGTAETAAPGRATRPRAAVTFVLLGVLLILLGRDDRKWVYRRPADENNPYAYSHTLDDVVNLAPYLERYWPHHDATIGVIAADPWPMPWYLRRFPRVGYWQPGEKPGDADLFITDASASEGLEAQLEGWRPNFFGVRPNVLFVTWKKPVAETGQP